MVVSTKLQHTLVLFGILQREQRQRDKSMGKESTRIMQTWR